MIISVHEPLKSGNMQVDERTRKGLAILFSLELWGGLAVTLELISLALPWWGITDLGSATSYWGVTPGPGTLQPVMFGNNLDTSFSLNYAFMVGLVLITVFLAGAGTYLRRGSVLTASFVFSIITMLIFLAEVEEGLSSGCVPVNGGLSSCVTSPIGQGTLGIDVVTWGFLSGFYAFMIASLFVLFAILLRPKEKWSAIEANPNHTPLRR
jgi:hypothetical protein